MIFGYKKKYLRTYEDFLILKNENEKLQLEVESLKSVIITLKENLRTISRDKEIEKNKNELLQMKLKRCNQEKEHYKRLLEKNSFANFQARVLSNIYLAEVINK